MNTLSLNQILLNLYKIFESDQITISVTRISRKNGTEINFFVTDEDKEKIYDGSIVVK